MLGQLGNCCNYPPKRELTVRSFDMQQCDSSGKNICTFYLALKNNTLLEILLCLWKENHPKKSMDEVKIKHKNFSGCFAANSLKHFIMSKCLEDKAQTEAIKNQLRMLCMGSASPGRQHWGGRKTKCGICTYNIMNKHMI